MKNNKLKLEVIKQAVKLDFIEVVKEVNDAFKISNKNIESRIEEEFNKCNTLLKFKKFLHSNEFFNVGNDEETKFESVDYHIKRCIENFMV